MHEDNNYLAHYGVLGMKWGVRRSKLSQLKREYKHDAKDARNARKEYVDSMPKVMLGFRDGNFGDKNAKSSYEKANAKANDSRYNYELAKSKHKGKATKHLVKISGEREYDRIYDNLLNNTNMHPDKIHEKAKAGRLKVEELVKKHNFKLEV